MGTPAYIVVCGVERKRDEVPIPSPEATNGPVTSLTKAGDTGAGDCRIGPPRRCRPQPDLDTALASSRISRSRCGTQARTM